MKFQSLMLICALVNAGCSPGMLDGVSNIPDSGGYGLSDSGGDERSIVYKSKNDKKWKIVIDSRVDEYVMHGESLYVSRRPNIRQLNSDEIMMGKVSSDCEIWVINTVSHEVKKLAGQSNALVACL